MSHINKENAFPPLKHHRAMQCFGSGHLVALRSPFGNAKSSRIRWHSSRALMISPELSHVGTSLLLKLERQAEITWCIKEMLCTYF